MKILLNKLLKNDYIRYLILFLIGGFTYYGIEMLWRGYSHYTMFVLGGMCFVIIGALNECYTYEMSIIGQMFLATILITLFEYLFGIRFNHDYSIWDYRHVPYNLHGQICLLYSNLWFLLSFVAIFLDDILRHILFNEKLKKYKLL